MSFYELSMSDPFSDPDSSVLLLSALRNECNTRQYDRGGVFPVSVSVRKGGPQLHPV